MAEHQDHERKPHANRRTPEKRTGKGHHRGRRPSLVHEFIQRGLADDYRIAVWPVILGRGNHYWGPMFKQQTLKLNSVKTLKNGELILHYETVR